MTDTRSPEQRSRIMKSVGTKDTGPEMIVRRLVHSLGYRYSLHKKELPGKPDLVFKSRRKVIFVHGCFWHGHECAKGRLPKSRTEYWKPKIEANKARDARNRRDIKETGWDSLVIWQCETKSIEKIRERIEEFLG